MSAQLNAAQDVRALTIEELDLCKDLKLESMGLCVIGKNNYCALTVADRGT